MTDFFYKIYKFIVMENSPTSIEKLIEKVEIYGKTSLQLLKSETLLKSSDIFSNLAARLAVIVLILIFSVFINIGFALWIGDYLGTTYYGFFVVAFVYLFLGILVYIFRNDLVKNPVSNFIIVKLQKKN